MTEFYDDLPELIREHSKLAIASITKTHGSTPRSIGAKMVIFPNGSIHGTLGGGKLELLVIQDAVMAIQKGESISKEYSLLEQDKGGIGVLCGGEATVFIEVITRGKSLLILGGGHIGLALYRMALDTDFNVSVVDDRPEFVSQERFPKAQHLLNCKVDDPCIKEIIDENTYIVIVTHAHNQDKLALRSFLDSGVKYIGMIGSKQKVKQTLAKLIKEGVSKEKLKNIYTPIGLDISAETPVEIAVSILAELIKVRNTGEPSSISLSKHYEEDTLC